MKTKIGQRIVLAVLVLLAVKAMAQGLPTAKPEDVGFSSDRLAYIDTFLNEKVNHGDLAGIVTLISRHGEIVHFSAIGYADLEKQRKMERDTIYLPSVLDDQGHRIHCTDDALRAGPLPDARSDLEIPSGVCQSSRAARP
jgi:hypothetical protein